MMTGSSDPPEQLVPGKQAAGESFEDSIEAAIDRMSNEGGVATELEHWPISDESQVAAANEAASR